MSLFQNSRSFIPALSQRSVSDKQYYCYISGLLLYDDIFPSQLKGKGPDGSEITLHACPELGAEVIEQEFFDPNEVRQIIHLIKVHLLISYLSQDMTPLLISCFYYISSRGLDRIFTILDHLFGGSIQILNEVKLT